MSTDSQGGRPSLYRVEFCERVIELGREGKSKAQIAADLGVRRMTLENWAAEHPEFLDAMELSRDLSLCWWEDQAQTGLVADKFNAALWSRSMAARFPADYTEKTKREVSGPDGGPIPTTITVVGIEPTK